jgi:oxalate decarboxylase/phosphoglucose isomerase-like protein (cupin superfamily)
MAKSKSGHCSLLTNLPVAKTSSPDCFHPGGELTVLTDGTIPIRHLSYVELREGKLRGNHYHKLRHETFYVISGELELRLQDLATGEGASIIMRTGDLARLDPEVVHTFVPAKSGHALEFAPEHFDATDVYRLS